MRKKYPVVGDQGRPGTRFRPADGFMDCVVASAPRNDEPYCHREPEACGRGGPCRLCSSLTGFGSLWGITALRKVKRKLQDRKSTRLNSSHVAISYAVCCM